MATITVRGLARAKAAFKALPDANRARMGDAIEVTAKQIVNGARARVLASPSVRTRRLLNAIAYTMNRKTGHAKVGITAGSTMIEGVRVKGIVTPGRNGSALRSAGARSDNPAKRAHFVEFGTVNMPAEPFMIPASDQQKMAHIDRCSREGKNIERDLAAIGGGLL